MAGQQVLFTRQRHDAKRAGLHFDYRIVVGDKAYSWATKKPMPAPGEAIIFHEQPVHTADYALSPEIEIPDGNYGAGKTTLDYVRKAKLGFHSEEGRFTLHMGDDKFLLKKLDPVKYGGKAWLFRNVTPYTEGPESTFTHDGKTWLVDKALDAARGKSIRKAKVSDLDWVLDHTQINRQRLKTANPSIPALVLNDPKHGLVVLDGAHRLAKAKELGWQSIPVRYVERKELGRAITKKANVNRYLEKIAKAKQQHQLGDHQNDALSKLDRSKGVILHHSLGSGKTRTFLLAAQKALDEDKSKRALIIAPASLVSNVDNELTKHNIKLDRKRLDVYSYEKATNIAEQLGKNSYSIAIADEAQKLRNPGTKRVQSLAGLMAKADKRLLATATANYNNAGDIAPLLNIAAGKELLPENKKEFENRYVRHVKKNPGFIGTLLRHHPIEYDELKNTKELKEAFKDHLHFYDAKDDVNAQDKFPTQSERFVDVEMSPEQSRYYKYMENKLPFMIRMKVRHGMPVDKKEKAQLNAFSTGVRQVSNSHRHLVIGGHTNFSPKIEAAAKSLKEGYTRDPNFRGLVYSNFLEAGIHEYSRKLQGHKIPHGVFTGSLSSEQKNQLVADYNSGKTPVLLVSSSGSEGISLKGTKKVQILDQFFNPSRLKQVIGRASRYESHSHLPANERHVDVEHYRSVHPKPFLGKAPTSIDKYLSEMSEDKQDVFNQMKELMKEDS